MLEKVRGMRGKTERNSPTCTEGGGGGEALQVLGRGLPCCLCLGTGSSVGCGQVDGARRSLRSPALLKVGGVGNEGIL